MQKSISKDRWKKAQVFELGEWKSGDEVVENEWKELVKKFSRLFPKIAKDIGLKKTDFILDVGCGPTVPARLLKNGKIIGIEPMAKKLGIEGRNKIPGVSKILTGMAEKLPFPDRKFKLVVCRNVIDHTQSPSSIIEEAHRVTKKDGHLLLICYTYAPFITWIKNTSERASFLNNVGHPFTFTPNMLDELVHSKYKIVKRFTIHTGQHSTDYGKSGAIHSDRSLINKVLIWINKHVFLSPWFLKEYGYLAQKV